MPSFWKRNDTTIAKEAMLDIVQQQQLNQAVQIAQILEGRAFNVAKLSVQELIDCDTKYDQGCIGGNPVMAFPYIKKYGLVSSIDYPYIGVDNRKCRKKNLMKPIVKTVAWGMLKARDEDNMEFALRHLGPISVVLMVVTRLFCLIVMVFMIHICAVMILIMQC